MAEETITMSQRELSRYEIIQRVINKNLNGAEAAKQLSLSARQVRRLKSRVKEYGAQGLIHKNKGRKGNKAMNQEKIISIKSLLTCFYSDFGPTFAQEKLKEQHKIKVSKEKLRQLMIEWNLWIPKPRKQNKEYRSWRPRKEQYGEMVQFDGSYHDWFENRAPQSCLLAAIDDATGKITKAQFANWENVHDVLAFWRSYVETIRKPINIYLDRHSTYKQNQKSVFDNPELLTQFGRVMKELDINIIYAHSPQAKGRIERLFGTLQDRLVKELRLQGLCDKGKANLFLEKVFIPDFNKKFAVVANKKGDLHRSLNEIEKERLVSIFSARSARVVNNDFTITFQGRWLQLAEIQPTLVMRKDKVTIEEQLDGSLHVMLRGQELTYQILPERPKKTLKLKIPALTRTKSSWRPPADHPWRQPLVRHKPEKVVAIL